MYYNQKGKDAGHSLLEKIGKDQKDVADSLNQLNISLSSLTQLVGTIAARVTALEKKKKKDD